MGIDYVMAWARAFAFTATIEIIAAALLFSRLLDVGSGEGNKNGDKNLRTPAGLGRLARLVGVIFYANLASHPAVWFVFPNLDLTYLTMVLAAECWAVVSEAILYWLVLPNARPVQAVGVSLIANASSFGIGLLVRAWTGWI
ncbi:MAG: hypothetical protein HUU21_07960 [Polyangiaceae bacterium]|nr:hypothetical protein [Polyangiaceae bacterium]NUQ73473.1 hypothetical protein [Polyangiaceae bacterium]